MIIRDIDLYRYMECNAIFMNETSHFEHLQHTFFINLWQSTLKSKLRKINSAHLINDHSFLYQIHLWDTYINKQNPSTFI
jgi:hypothetical protein